MCALVSVFNLSFSMRLDRAREHLHILSEEPYLAWRDDVGSAEEHAAGP